jgi:hypothetical protein
LREQYSHPPRPRTSLLAAGQSLLHLEQATLDGVVPHASCDRVNAVHDGMASVAYCFAYAGMMPKDED